MPECLRLCTFDPVRRSPCSFEAAILGASEAVQAMVCRAGTGISGGDTVNQQILVAIGDSITEYNNRYTASTELSNQSAGGIIWAQASAPHFYFSVVFDASDPLGRSFEGYNQGDTGDTASGVVASGRLSRALAYNPYILIIALGTNDLTGGASVSAVQDSLTTILNDSQAAGVPIIILKTILPRSDWATPDVQTDPRYQRRVDLNAWIVSQQGSNVYVWNPENDVNDPASRQGLGGWPFTGYMDSGGVHPGSLGGEAESRTLTTLIETLLSDVPLIYNPTANNLLTNWELAGTSGTRNPNTAGIITGPGGGATQIADTWRVNRNSGNNANAVETTKEADGSTSKQVLAFKPGGSGTFENWAFQYLPGGTAFFARPAEVQDGQWVQGFVTLEAGAWAYWGGYNLYVAARSSADVVLWQGFGLKYQDRTNQNYPNRDETVTIATTPFQVTSAMAKFQFQIEAYPKMISADSNGILKISKPWFGVVSAPLG